VTLKDFSIFFWAMQTFLAAFISSKEVELFTPSGRQVEDYEIKLQAIEDGDLISFQKGAYKFQVIGEALGSGGTTKIYKVVVKAPSKMKDKEVALRVPLHSGDTLYDEFRHVTPYVDFIDEFRTGIRHARRNGIKTPEIYLFESKQFVAVEVIPKSFDLKEFLSEDYAIDPSVKAKAEEALIKFAKESAHLAKIGDFNPVQLAYRKDTNEWVLLDSSKGTQVWDQYQDYVMEHSISIPKNASPEHAEWLRSINQRIKETSLTERAKKSNYFKQCKAQLIIYFTP
jgi:hypothetical protein